MLTELLTSVCNQPSAMGSGFCWYCVGIYTGIAVGFPSFLWAWRRFSMPRLRYFVAGGIFLLGLMALEFTLHHWGAWSLPLWMRTLIGLGNGAAFGAIAGFFWNYLLGDRIPPWVVYVGCAALGMAFLLATRSPGETVLYLGVFLRFFVATTLIIAALVTRKTGDRIPIFRALDRQMEIAKLP